MLCIYDILSAKGSPYKTKDEPNDISLRNGRDVRGGVSIFTWLKQKALNKDLSAIDDNGDGKITAIELARSFQNDNDYTATPGESTISEVIVREADQRGDGDGKTSTKELYNLIFGSKIQEHVDPGIVISLQTPKIILSKNK